MVRLERGRKVQDAGAKDFYQAWAWVLRAYVTPITCPVGIQVKLIHHFIHSFKSSVCRVALEILFLIA